MKPNRCRFQYSMRTLLIFLLLASIGMAWFGAKWRAARQQRDAVAAIRALGGLVTYDYEADYVASRANGPCVPPGPAWALALLGEDFFADVVAVHVSRLLIGGPPRSVPITDAWLEHIGKLSRLEVLDLKDSCVSDAGLKQIQRLTRLRRLDLRRDGITDAGLVPIGKLTRLEVLNLFLCRRVSDVGAEELGGLTRLQVLDISGTRITDSGLEKLEGLPCLRELSLFATAITDLGLKHIGKLVAPGGVEPRTHAGDGRRLGGAIGVG